MNVAVKRTLAAVIGFLLVSECDAHVSSEIHVDNLLEDFTDANDPNLPKDLNKILATTEEATRRLEDLAQSAEQTIIMGPVDKSDAFYDSMAEVLDDIIYAVYDKTHAHEFLKAKGLNRVVSANLGNDHPELRTKLMILLKVLFDVAPVTTSAVIPKVIVSKLLDIFEYEDDLAMKAYALDVLHRWLPNNPEIQIRVMKLKGLEPFYSQINKLGVPVIQTLLDLFNKVLKEHVEARSDNPETKLDAKKLGMYQKIGLLERLETSTVCNGLINIFQVVWANKNNGDIVKTVLALVNTTKPFCEDILKGKPKAMVLLDNMLKFIKDEDQKQYFEEIGLNALEFQSVIEDYVDKVKTEEKDEL